MYAIPLDRFIHAGAGSLEFHDGGTNPPPEIETIPIAAVSQSKCLACSDFVRFAFMRDDERGGHAPNFDCIGQNIAPTSAKPIA
jgi:hypothetical protein